MGQASEGAEAIVFATANVLPISKMLKKTMIFFMLKKLEVSARD
jgi:hypothetical protein